MEVHKEVSSNLDCTGGNPLNVTTKRGQSSVAFWLRKVRFAYEQITYVLKHYFAANHLYFHHRHHHHHWHNSPFWTKVFFRSFRQLSLFLAAFLRFFSPDFLASSITPSSHLSFVLPICLFPSTTATRTLLAGLCSSSRITCPAHLRRLILMYVTILLSLYDVYSSLLYFILHSPFSFVGPKMALKIFL